MPADLRRWTRTFWLAVDRLFVEALDRPPEARAAYLEAATDDPELRRAVLDLLADAEAAVDLLPDRLGAVAPTLLRRLAEDDADPARLAAGRRVGPYEVAALIGEGGMGAVYRAERADGAFERTVALKLVRQPLAAPHRVARFLAERRTLARLDHPGIAALLDAGLTDDGVPWFAMELVAGEPITDHAERLGLGVDERLALFLQACDAVAHAHRHLVVHRDLKPDHIVVTPEGAVRLLDFGIARALDEDEALTQPGGVLCTPAYAAPEQRAGDPPTTATDVYALGAVLFELLAGARPEAEAPRPPSRVAPERLARRLRGDLDAITAMALRPEPARRYPSAEALADDLRRHRDGLPVRARPDTAAYRAGRFVRRHRAGVAAAAAFVLLLLAFSAALALQVRETRLQRDAAREQRDRAREALLFLAETYERHVTAADSGLVAAPPADLPAALTKALTDTP